MKYGTLNLILIAVVIAIVIVFNTIVTLLTDVFGWRVDMTQEQLYTVSDPCVELLDKVSGDTQIDIIFCCDKDKAERTTPTQTVSMLFPMCIQRQRR